MVFRAKLLQLCPTLWDPMDCSLPGSSVHGISQARILEWIAMLSFRGSSQPRDQTHVFYCLPHWQADSLPQRHLGSPNMAFKNYYKVTIIKTVQYWQRVIDTQTHLFKISVIFVWEGVAMKGQHKEVLQGGRTVMYPECGGSYMNPHMLKLTELPRSILLYDFFHF